MSKNPSLPEVRHPFSRERVFAPLSGESLTHQSHAEACDINRVIKRYDNTGLLPPGSDQGQYLDVTHLQGDPATLINESRQTLSQVENDVSAHRAAVKKKRKEEQLDLEDEVKRLRDQVSQLSDDKSD